MTDKNINSFAQLILGQKHVNDTFCAAVAEALTRIAEDEIGEEIRRRVAEVRDDA